MLILKETNHLNSSTLIALKASSLTKTVKRFTEKSPGVSLSSHSHWDNPSVLTIHTSLIVTDAVHTNGSHWDKGPFPQKQTALTTSTESERHIRWDLKFPYRFLVWEARIITVYHAQDVLCHSLPTSSLFHSLSPQSNDEFPAHTSASLFQVHTSCLWKAQAGASDLLQSVHNWFFKG